MLFLVEIKRKESHRTAEVEESKRGALLQDNQERLQGQIPHLVACHMTSKCEGGCDTWARQEHARARVSVVRSVQRRNVLARITPS